MNKPPLSILLVGSFVLAIAGLATSPWMALIGNNQATNEIMWSIGLAGPLWVVLALISFLRYGKRALWILLGLPFALASHAWLVLLMIACSKGEGCL